MCGVCGIIFKNYSKGDTYSESVKVMCKNMWDRGPDNSGLWIGKNVVLGHTRLAIMDPSNPMANQPVESENWVLIFNGEIYNFRALRHKLELRGIIFKTDSDTEVLLNHIQEYGIDQTLTVLNGIFAFCAYEKSSGKTHLVRDQLGIKPMYFWLDPKLETFWFASTPAAIVEANVEATGQSWDLNKQAVFSFFHLGAPGARPSFFNKLNRLRPAEHMVVNNKLEVSKNRYWTPSFNKLDIEEAVTEVILMEKETHVNSSVFLSGGIDSSVMAAVLSDVKGFHLSSPEEKYAKYVSDFLKIPLKVREFSNDIDFDKLLNKYSASSGEASASSPIPLMVAELITSDGYKVAFSANGADELFFGYHRTTIPELKPEAFTALDYEQSSVKSHEDQYYHIFRDESSIIIPDFDSPKNRQSTRELYEINELDGDFPESAHHRWFELQTYVGCDLNPTLDFASMACSLEVRVPFLNRNLVEIALSHDGNDFVSSDYGRKQPLKRLLKKFGFHPSLWSRSKVGFSIPDDIVKKRDDGINIHLEELEERNLFKLGVSKQNSARDYIYLNSAIQAFNIWARVWVDSGKVSI